ncbi:MAG: 4-(cytidine 5'-diphospho)-2-C-methyl-D-erythritol kinase [Proteobacteria bacterium]|nr:4-(cytidine 5'-diphospho)-2-C-methyl-D-erythritol kinase [Pseudomonadota bacterium]
MEIRSPAKINLFLAVTGKRPDGYHNLITLFCRISLYDQITLDMDHKGIAVSCDHPDVPNDHTNTAYKAAEVFLSRLENQQKVSFPGIHIQIEKNIPTGAGLGGGSSNAASVLLGLNEYFGFPFTHKTLMEMATPMGADVPFFIFQEPGIGRGIGDQLTPYPEIPNYKVVLVYPKKNISTRQVYKNLNLALTKCEQKLNGLLFKNETFRADLHLCNDLEPVSIGLCPEIPSIKQVLNHHGAEGSMMTGSGSSVFGLFSNGDVARTAYGLLSDHKNWQVFLLDLLI